jgi:hypothetical protein
VNTHLLDETEASALAEKQKHWALIRKKLKRKKSIAIPARPGTRSINDYPIGKFENLERSRLEWVHPNYFEFIPKTKSPFSFVRSTGEPITPKNFFTDGGSIPRLFRWSDELDPFGSLPAYLLHDWEFDLHHCNQSTKTFEDVASILMEALHTLMDLKLVTYDTFVFWMIETGINSWVAHDAWNNMPPKCPLPPYKPE